MSYSLSTCAQLLSPVWPFATPWTVACQASVSIKAKILERVAISSSRVSSWSRDQTSISCIGWQIIYHWNTFEAPYFLYISLKKNFSGQPYHLHYTLTWSRKKLLFCLATDTGVVCSNQFSHPGISRESVIYVETNGQIKESLSKRFWLGIGQLIRWNPQKWRRKETHQLLLMKYQQNNRFWQSQGIYERRFLKSMSLPVTEYGISLRESEILSSVGDNKWST